MRFLCRWHIAWSGVPSSRPFAVAIAFAVVGGMLLETGVVARTPIESSDAPAPIAAMIGSGDVLVAMAATGRDTSLAPRGLRVSGPAVLDAVAQAEPPVGAGLLDVLAFDPALLVSALPGPTAPSQLLLDPDQPAQYQALAAEVDDAPAARTVVARAAGTSAKAGVRRRHRRHAGPWRLSPLVTWYGPGFYGHRTACGQRYSRYVVGVAHRTLPCGTLVQFRWHGRLAVAPVIDRGPYGPRNLVFDWSAWLACRVFRPKGLRNGCFTRADVHYRVVGKVDLHTWFGRRKRHR